MRSDAPQKGEPATVSPDRAAEMAGLVDRMTRWAASRPDIVGLLLVGSYARQAVRPDSDVDFVMLTTDEHAYTTSAWIPDLALGTLIRTQSWGAVTERRFVTASGLEFELNIGSPDWAGIDPVDPGTYRVVAGGARILHDTTGALASLAAVCQR